MVENNSVVLGHQQIGVAVAIVIGGGHPHAVASPRHARFLGDIGECSVPVISVKSIPEWRLRVEKITLAAVD